MRWSYASGMPWERTEGFHRWVRKRVGAILLALAAVSYKTAQELGYFPKDIFLFPLLVIMFVLFVLYAVVTCKFFIKGLGLFYERFGKDRRMVAYIIVVFCGMLAGGALAGGGYWLFEIHKKHMQTLSGTASPESQDPAHKRSKIKAEMTKLAQGKEWGSLAKILPSVEIDPALRDVGLYFRGLLYTNARPAPDPERFLSQVPQESDLFSETQRTRLHNYALAPNEQLSKAILDSLDRANLRNPIYYTLRLMPPPQLSHREIMGLYEDFVRRHRDLFDFTEMKPVMRGQVGVYLEIDLNTVADIPGCVLLFIARQLHTAHYECLKGRKRVVLSEYDKLTKNINSKTLDDSLRRLSINPNIKNDIEYLRNKPLPDKCK
jgi:hypothetical protein